MGLIGDIGEGPVALDTPVFVYFIEEHPQYLPVVEPVFAAVASGALEAVTSGLTLLETLVVPFRAGDMELAARYELLLTRGRGLRMVDLSRAVLRAAARLRSQTRLRIPDAIQAAAAILGGARRLLTNDRRMPVLPGLRVLQLRDYLT